VTLDSTGHDVAARFPRQTLPKLLAPVPPVKAKAVLRIPPEALRNVLNQARAQAEAAAAPVREKALARMRAHIEAELLRLRALQSRNGLVSSGEIAWWEERERQLEAALRESRVRLDSFLLVVPPAVLG
jgi:hypothetical protein